jgi:acyl carrier protein
MNLRSDLGLDSMGLAALAFLIEEELGIDVQKHAKELTGLVTIEHLITVASRLHAANDGG